MSGQVSALYEVFKDLDGLPLESGYIYIGTSGLNPETNPISVYIDEALQIPIAQPIRTVGGSPIAGNAPAVLFFSGAEYSITTRSKSKSLVKTELTKTDENSGLRVELASTTAESSDPTAGVLGFHLVSRQPLAAELGVTQSEYPYGDIRRYGAKVDGTTDDTAAVLLAIATGFAEIFFPAGTTLITATLTITAHDQALRGAGQNASQIKFTPVANDVCVVFDNGASSISRNSITDLGFTSDDTAYVKTAVHVVSGSEFIFKNSFIFPWSDSTDSCIGLQINGHETGTINHLRISTDRPIVIGVNPYSFVDIDHWHFSDLNLVANNNPCVEILTGVDLTNVTFDGYQAWVKGTYGLYWLDTTTVSNAISLVIKNVRTEQGQDATKESIYISHNTALNNLILENIRCNTSRPAFYFRKVRKIILTDISHAPVVPKVSLDTTAIDTNYSIEINSCVWSTSTTKTLTAYKLKQSDYQQNTGSGFAPMPDNAFYVYNGDTASSSRNAVREMDGTFRWTWKGNIASHLIDNAAAVNKGSGLVGIPITGHDFSTGQAVDISSTTNYNGSFTIISQTTNEIVITDTYNAETFAGTEHAAGSIDMPSSAGQIFSGLTKNGIIHIIANNAAGTSFEHGTVYEWCKQSSAGAVGVVGASANFVATVNGVGTATKVSYVNKWNNSISRLYNNTDETLAVFVVTNFTLDSTSH